MSPLMIERLKRGDKGRETLDRRLTDQGAVGDVLQMDVAELLELRASPTQVGCQQGNQDTGRQHCPGDQQDPAAGCCEWTVQIQLPQQPARQP